jgi:hypothetical protein
MLEYELWFVFVHSIASLSDFAYDFQTLNLIVANYAECGF